MSTAGVDGHMRYRKLVCVVCYKKGNRDISANELLWIQDNLIDGYDANNDANFPAAMCAHCHILLSQRINGIDMKQQLPKVESYDPGQPILLRDSKCGCRICTVATSNLNVSKSKKRGRPRPKQDTDSVAPPPSSIKICSKCFSRVGKGLPHNYCSSRREKVSNVESLLQSTPTTSQRVASRIIDKAGTPFLQTLGSKPKPVAAVNPKKQLFTAQDMSVVQKDLSLNTRQVLTLAEDLRNSSGDKKMIEKNLRDKIRGFNRNLEDLFERRICNFVILFR